MHDFWCRQVASRPERLCRVMMVTGQHVHYTGRPKVPELVTFIVHRISMSAALLDTNPLVDCLFRQHQCSLVGFSNF
jgi:hypothetical protein